MSVECIQDRIESCFYYTDRKHNTQQKHVEVSEINIRWFEARIGICMYPLFQGFFRWGSEMTSSLCGAFWKVPNQGIIKWSQMIGNAIKWLVLFNSWFLQVVGPGWRSWMEWNGAPINERISMGFTELFHTYNCCDGPLLVTGSGPSCRGRTFERNSINTFDDPLFHSRLDLLLERWNNVSQPPEYERKNCL